MRPLKNVLLPAFLLLMLVAMPLAESVFANDLPPPQATPVSDEHAPPAKTDQNSEPMQRSSASSTESIPVNPDIALIVQTELCGSNNDVIDFAQTGINYTLGSWTGNQNTIRFAPDQGYAFADDAITSHLLTDADNPCITAAEFDFEEGTFLNRIQGGTVYVDVTFTLEDSHTFDFVQTRVAQDGSHANFDMFVAVTPGDGASYTTTHWLPSTDDSLHCTDNADVQLTGTISGMIDGEVVRSSVVVFEETHPCSWSTPLVPEGHPQQNDVCGPNNDTFTMPDYHEAISYTIGEWEDGVAFIELHTASGFYIPDQERQFIRFEDDDSPCITSAQLNVDEGAFLNRIPGVDVPVGFTFTLADGHPYISVRFSVLQQGKLYPDRSFNVEVEPGAGDTFHGTHWLPTERIVLGPQLYCENDADIHIEAAYGGFKEGEWSAPVTWIEGYYPCTWATEVVPVADITQLNVCGPNNDDFSIADQPDGVSYNIQNWSNGSTTVEFFPTYENLHFPDGTKTTFSFDDADDPCLQSIALDAVDGAFVDTVPILSVPMTVTVTLDDTHEYETMQLILYRDRAAAPLGSYHKDFDVQPGDGGPYTVDIQYPGTPVGFEPFTCVDGEIELQIAARPYDPISGGLMYSTEISETKSFPCSFLTEAVPDMGITHVTVCGPNNDVFEIAGQPDGVGYTIHDWSDGKTIVEFYPEKGYYFGNLPEYPEFDFSDQSTPCPTDAPAPPVQTQVCGPNNDTLTIPPQPEGVELDLDTGWEDGERWIFFAVDHAFETDGETEFEFTDANIACPVATSTLTVQLIPSDEGSLEHGSWQLFAPVAAQNIGTNPYAEGTIDAHHVIVIENLIAGDYRLVVSADGYDVTDSVLTVSDGEEMQVVRLDVLALQPEETPTPEPTVQPTVAPSNTPTPEPTEVPTMTPTLEPVAEPTLAPTLEPVTEPTLAPTTEPTTVVSLPEPQPEATPTQVPFDPTPAPTHESANVSGLPSTGSGPGGGFGTLALAGLLAATILGAIGNRRKLRS